VFAGSDVPGPGEAARSSAVDEESRSDAERYRSYSKDELVARAQAHLQVAKERNPLAPQINVLMDKLIMIVG
jgi:hypothetical protein